MGDAVQQMIARIAAARSGAATAAANGGNAAIGSDDTHKLVTRSTWTHECEATMLPVPTTQLKQSGNGEVTDDDPDDDSDYANGHRAAGIAHRGNIAEGATSAPGTKAAELHSAHLTAEGFPGDEHPTMARAEAVSLRDCTN